MRHSIAILLTGTLVLSGCGGWRDSRANPSNWFGGSQPAATEVQQVEGVNPLIPQKTGSNLFARPEAEDTSVLISSVTELRIDRTATGAIIYATGLASRQGAHDVTLRRNENAEEGVLEFGFRATFPEYQTAVGSEFSRTLRAAASLSNRQLAGVKVIRVTSASNARESRRR